MFEEILPTAIVRWQQKKRLHKVEKRIAELDDLIK